MIRGARLAVGAAALGLLLGGPADARSHPDERSGVSAMVARVLPAVVSITTRQIERDQLDEVVVTPGLGSGIIVDRRGYILTNDHVIQGVDQIKVALADERTFRATLVGRDPFTDLAVLKIEGKNLPVATLGDSRRLAIGQMVVAIGNPLWIEGGATVTAGVVSDLPVERGALIKRVEPGGPADRAGLEAGDIVTAIDDRSVKDLHHLHDFMARPGRVPGITVEENCIEL